MSEDVLRAFKDSLIESEATISGVARETFLSIGDEQDAKGLEVYGRPLECFNGRDAYRDAVAEQYDAILYTTQLMTETAVFARMLKVAADAIDRMIVDGGPALDIADSRELVAKIRAALAGSGIAQTLAQALGE